MPHGRWPAYMKRELSSSWPTLHREHGLDAGHVGWAFGRRGVGVGAGAVDGVVEDAGRSKLQCVPNSSVGAAGGVAAIGCTVGIKGG